MILIINKPGAESISKIILKKIISRNSWRILNLIFSIIACKFLSQWFQAIIDPRTWISGKIRNKLGIFPVLSHYFQSMKLAFLIILVSHEQVINQDMGIKWDIVPYQCSLIFFKELFKHHPNIPIRKSLAKIYGKGCSMMLIPCKRNRSYSWRIMLQGIGFYICCKHGILKQFLQFILNIITTRKIRCSMNDFFTWITIVPVINVIQLLQSKIYLFLNIRLIEYSEEVGNIHDLTGTIFAIQLISQIHICLGFTSQHFEIITISNNNMLDMKFIDCWDYFFFKKLFLDVSWSSLFSGFKFKDFYPFLWNIFELVYVAGLDPVHSKFCNQKEYIFLNHYLSPNSNEVTAFSSRSSFHFL